MILLQKKTALLFLPLILSLSDIAVGQASSNPANLQNDTSLTGGAVTVVKDTLSPGVDTLHARMDTAAAVKDTVAAKKDTLDIIVGSENYNTTPGFRVQIGSTQDLSEAINERANADTVLTDYNIYIVYDSPNYKVRAGDFRSRYDATQAANYIAAHGFPGAWLVPDSVFRNPPPKNKQR